MKMGVTEIGLKQLNLAKNAPNLAFLTQILIFELPKNIFQPLELM